MRVTSKSFVQQTLGAVVQTTHAAITKPLGYRKRGRSLVLDTGDLFHVINFQGSQWGSADSGQFTINLGVIWPFFHEKYLSQPMPPNPASAKPSVAHRIGFLLPQNEDIWWPVHRNTRTDLLAAEMQCVLSNFALPFLKRFGTVAQLVSELQNGIDIQAAACSPEYLRAAAQAFAGDRAGATNTLHAMLSSKRSNPWDAIVRRLLHNLDLDTKG